MDRREQTEQYIITRVKQTKRESRELILHAREAIERTKAIVQRHAIRQPVAESHRGHDRSTTNAVEMSRLQ